MSDTPILGITEVAPNQNSKEASINNGFVAIENATQGMFTVTFVSNAATLSFDQFVGAFQFVTGSAEADSTLTVPLGEPRFFFVDNSSGSYNITAGGASGGSVTVVAAACALIFCDGTNCKAILAGGATSGVASVLGDTGAITLADLTDNGVAPIDSPTFTTVVNLPAVSGSDNSTKAASTAWVNTYVAGLDYVTATTSPVRSVAGLTGIITLGSLVAAGLAPVASPSFTGAPTSATAPAANDSSTKIPTTAWVQNLFAAIATGFSVHLSVRAIAISNITLTAPGATIDGVSLNAGDRIGVIGQTDAYDNGIYVWTGAATTATRAPDADTAAELAEGTFFFVEEGTDYAATGWIQTTNGTITLGTTDLVFAQFAAVSDYSFSSGVVASGSSVTVDFTVVAPLANPTFTGTVTVPTPSSGSDTTVAATTAWVHSYYAPLANPTFTGTVTVPTPASSTDNTTKAASTAWVQEYVATLDYITDATANVIAVIGNTGSVTLAELVSGGVAPLASPTFTGTVDASGAANVYVPTVGTSDNSTNAASTAFCHNLVAATVQGLQIKPTATWATATALPANTYAGGSVGVGATLTGNSEGALSVDGEAVSVNDIVLVMNESTTANNGLYTVTAAGGVSAYYVLTRSVDMDTATDFLGAFIAVGPGGTVNANTLWLCETLGSVTFTSTSITFVQLNGATSVIEGTGITISANTISLAAIATAGVMGNVGGTTVSPYRLTATQLTTLVNTFTTSLSGAVSASGGGTTNFLRADGNWEAPPLNSGTVTQVTVAAGSGMSGGGTITSSGTITVSMESSQLIRTIPFTFVGTLPSGQTYNVTMTQGGTLLANGGTPQGYIPVDPSATQDIILNTIHNGTVTAQGTISISTAGSITWPSFTAVTMAAGDSIQMKNQATADATFANACLALQYQVT